MATHEEVQEALAALRSAITTYFSVIEPDAYIDDWMLVVHKQSIALSQDNTSAVGLVIPDGQPAYRTAGLLSVAGEMAVYDFEDDD